MSGGKAARHQAEIVNRPSGGGNKKGGLPPTFWSFTDSNRNMIGATQMLPVFSMNPYSVSLPGPDPLNNGFSRQTGGPNFVSRVIQTQAYGYKATHGGNAPN